MLDLGLTPRTDGPVRIFAEDGGFVLPDVGLRILDESELGRGSPAKSLSITATEGEEIVVIGTRLAYTTISYGSTGDYNDSRVSRRPDDGSGVTNTDFAVANDDATCEDGAAVNASGAISDTMETEGNFEFVGVLVQNSDGTFGLANNEISTRHLTGSSSFDALSNYSSAFGIIQTILQTNLITTVISTVDIPLLGIGLRWIFWWQEAQILATCQCLFWIPSVILGSSNMLIKRFTNPWMISSVRGAIIFRRRPKLVLEVQQHDHGILIFSNRYRVSAVISQFACLHTRERGVH